VRRKTCAVWFVLTVLLVPAFASAVTIYDVQYSDAANNWESAYYDEVTMQTVDVTGGVVTYAATPPGKSFSRVVIQDPTQTVWAGIEIKILDSTPVSSFQVGDLVSLTSVGVDESRGATYLIFDNVAHGSAFSVVSSGHSVAPTVVSPAVLGAGEQIAAPAPAEKYEGMLLCVEDVHVGAMDQGKAADNYELINLGSDKCWGGDYLNVDRTGPKYHDYTATGQSFDAVIGVLEQYTKASSNYDYYQLLTRSSADFIPEPATLTLLLGGAGLLLFGQKRSGKAKQ